MRLFFSLVFLNVGVVISGFSQDLENPESKIKPSLIIPKSLPPLLEIPLQFSPDTVLFDSAKVFIPNNPFVERKLNFSPPLIEKPIPGIYALPDPQSRMPIKKFDDSVNYTILRKEYK